MTELQLFEATLEQSPSERVAFLEKACAGNQPLRERLEALLARHQWAANFLKAPAADMNAASDILAEQRPGTVIAGRYKLLEQIGAGGMGSVWVAEQTEPVKRRVALKLIKPGMDSRQVLSRFEAERQALALMGHPNIARVFDGGLTDQGRPFFVMEYVKGVPITEYCDNARLSIQERLKLFVPICQAVQHAHQKGIIHRDLKPSNILVAEQDDQPVPKVIDFGLAKAMHQPLTEHTLYTAHGMMVGTPLYMSPEQAEVNNLDVDTRSDIYSLGVILYELLTGTTPVEMQSLRDAAWQEILRLIKEVEPLKPSLKLSASASLPSVAAQRRLEPAQLRRTVQGDLDWIVMKSLEKERSRRYATANGLARDVERYLSDEPVEACPPSASYRLKRFLRRNKGPVLAAAALILTLVGGIVGTTWGLIRAKESWQAEAQQRKLAETAREREAARAEAEAQQRRRAETAESTARDNERQAASERDRADQEKRIAQVVKDFLQDLLYQADPKNQANALLRAGGTSAETKENPTIRELLDRAAAELTPAKIEAQFPKLPLVQAEILGTVGTAYRGLGQYGPAIAHLERARDLYVLTLGMDHPDILLPLNNLAVAYKGAGRLREAMQIFERVHQQQSAKLGADHSDTLLTMNYLAATYQSDGKLREAIQLFEQVRQQQTAKLGANHPDTLLTLNNLATAYKADGKLSEAIQLFEQVRDQQTAQLGPDHPDTLITLNNLALTYMADGKLKVAIQLLEQVRDQKIAKLGADHPSTLITLNNLARAYQADGKLPDAIQLYEHVRDLQTPKLGPDHPDTLLTMNYLAFAYWADKRLPDAIQLYEQVRDLQTAQLGPDHPVTLTTLNNLATVYRVARKLPEAIQLFEHVREQRIAQLGADHSATLTTLNNLAGSYQDAGELPHALRLWEEVIPRARRVFGPAHSSTIAYTNNWCIALDAAREFGKAAEVRRELLTVRRQQLPADDPRLADDLLRLGDSLLKAEQFGDAEPVIEECLTIREKAIPDAWETFNAKSLLGAALFGQRKYADAEPLLLAGCEGMMQREGRIPPNSKFRLTDTLQRLVDLYTAWNKPDDAAQWKKQLDAAAAPDQRP